jgi:hypothetical protein
VRSVVHERTRGNIRYTASSYTVTKTTLQQSFALIVNLEIFCFHARFGRRNSSENPAAVNSHQVETSRESTYPCAIGVGKGASGSSETSSHCLTLSEMAGGAIHSNAGNWPLAEPSAVYGNCNKIIGIPPNRNTNSYSGGRINDELTASGCTGRLCVALDSGRLKSFKNCKEPSHYNGTCQAILVEHERKQRYIPH